MMGLWARLPTAAHVAVGLAGVALVAGPIVVAARPAPPRHAPANGDAAEFNVGTHPQKTGAPRTADLLASTCATKAVLPAKIHLHIAKVVDRCADASGEITQRRVLPSGFVELDVKPATGATLVVKVYARNKTCPLALPVGAAHELTCLGDLVRHLAVGAHVTVKGPLVQADGRAQELLPAVSVVVDQAAPKKAVRHRRARVGTTATTATTAKKK